MFVKAIETADRFTRPIHFISRNYGSTTPLPGAATLFFVHADGWALTCRHVAEQLRMGNELTTKRQGFLNELTTQHGQKKEKHWKHELENKYGYTPKTTYELLSLVVN
jgi:hypothetical protein